MRELAQGSRLKTAPKPPIIVGNLCKDYIPNASNR